MSSLGASLDRGNLHDSRSTCAKLKNTFSAYVQVKTPVMTLPGLAMGLFLPLEVRNHAYKDRFSSQSLGTNVKGYKVLDSLRISPKPIERKCEGRQGS